MRIRIRIQQLKLMRIHADPDPDTDPKPWFKGTQDWDFFGFDFEIYIISLLVISKNLDFTKKKFDWAIIGGGTIFPRSPRTTQNGKKICIRTKFFFFHLWTLYMSQY